MKKFLKRLLALVLLAAAIHVWCSMQIRPEMWIVKSDRLPQAFEDLRITLLTDLHGASFGKDNEKLLQAVEQASPDLIAISGDIVDRYSKTDVLQPLLTKLTELAPVFYVTGNHEWDRADTEQILDLIADCGVTVLRNDYVTVTQDGQTLVIAGAEDPNGYADQETPDKLMERIRQDIPQDPYVVMLYHRNNSLQLWSQLGADLVLAGHGHGGVVRLPGIGGLVGVDRRLFPKDCEGLYTEGRTTLAVSCGLAGMRLWNRPHLPTVLLEREQ